MRKEKDGSGIRRAQYLIEYYKDHPEMLMRDHHLIPEEAEKIINLAISEKLYG